MSLRGRYIIDRIKSAVSHRFTLPCPPYESLAYWEKVYKTLGPNDVFEWGDFNLTDDLLRYRFDSDKYAPEVRRYGFRPAKDSIWKDDGGDSTMNTVSTTFGETMKIRPGGDRKKVVLMGSGNSRLGEELLQHGWNGPIVQVDISQRVLTTTSERCAHHVAAGDMDFIHDDARELNAFDDASVNCVIDKGLMDALYCADQEESIENIMENVHRSLVPGGTFICFSFSRPEFIFEKMMRQVRVTSKWRDVQIRELDNVLMYLYEKKDVNKVRSKRPKELKNRRRSWMETQTRID